MLSEIKAAEKKLKQILYGCVEHVKATKAALYLSATTDLNEKTFELVTSYQFHDEVRNVLKANDVLVDRLSVKRNAFFVNGLGTDPRFSEMLFRQGTDRLLGAPMFSRGRLVGFIDMRDKAAKMPFENPDLEAATKITEEMLAFLGSKHLYGIGPIQLVHEPRPRTAQHPVHHEEPSQRALQPEPATEDLSPQAQRAIAAAREIMTKKQIAPSTVKGAKGAATERDVDVFRLLLPSAIAIPGAVLACVSVVGNLRNPLAIVALASVGDDAAELLQKHLELKLKSANQPHLTSRAPLIYPFGVQAVPITGPAITAIVSSALNPQVVDGLLLTVAFERTPERQAQRALHVFVKQMEHSLDAALAVSAGRTDRQLIAEKLLEPDFQKYPDLTEHSRDVASIAHRFAELLDLSPPVVETVRVAAMVHDVGFRLLDYERLYKKTLSEAEQRAITEHPTIGAALVEPLLGTDVAQAVLRHHERIDGKGYPSRLSGQQIPLASRIIQIVDAWVAMTSSNSYQPPFPTEEAVERLRDSAGTQFDDELVMRFLELLPQLLG